mgnify:CR=1 FL=1
MNENGYILFINLVIITLLGLFIPLLIQQQQINFKITQGREKAVESREAAEAGLEYQLYLLEKENRLVDEEIYLKENLKIKVKGKEDDNFIYLHALVGKNNPYFSEIKISKESLKIINKIIFRSY